MKIVFSVPAEQLHAKREEIFALCKDYMPGAYVEIDEHTERLCVEMYDTGDPDARAEDLRLRLLGIGVSAARVGNTHQNYSGPYTSWQTTPPPPINMKFKQPRTVRLWVFVTSLVAAVLLVSILAFQIGSLVANPFDTDGTLGTGEEQGENYAEKIALIDYIFKEYGLYDTDGQLLLDEMLKAYVAATGDKYAAYYTAEELEMMMSEMGGSAVGIGVTVTWEPDQGHVLIIQVSPGSPADKAGVKTGDAIVAVGSKEDGERVSDLGYEMAMKKMAGEKGTEAVFVIKRGSEEIEFTVIRDEFAAVSVNCRVSDTDPTVGIVRISGFDANTPTQFKRAMNELLEKDCDKFVFDVRNNPGGEQKSVMAVLSYFLKENDVIMSTVTKDGTTTYFRAEEATYEGDYAACSVKKEEIGMYRDYPMVVLTNGYTASAGELFTATLSEYNLATLVGENTYGKGVIQSIYDLSTMGYSGGLKLTIGYYAPPSGENYDGEGIAPDIEIKPGEQMIGKNLYLLTEQEDNQLAGAIDELLN